MHKKYKYKGIIWDFNGTLLDDVSICLDAINALLARRSFPLLTEQRYKDIFGFPVKQYYEELGFNFDVEEWDIVAHEYMTEYWDRQDEAQLFNNIPNLLKELTDNGVQHFVLSAMENKNLKLFLETLEIADSFHEIKGIDNHFADGKTELGIAMIEASHLNRKELVLIGDTLHDFDVAQKMGIDCILFDGGHQSTGRLEKMPCPLAKTHNEIVKLIAKN